MATARICDNCGATYPFHTVKLIEDATIWNSVSLNGYTVIYATKTDAGQSKDWCPNCAAEHLNASMREQGRAAV